VSDANNYRETVFEMLEQIIFLDGLDREEQDDEEDSEEEEEVYDGDINDGAYM